MLIRKPMPTRRLARRLVRRVALLPALAAALAGASGAAVAAATPIDLADVPLFSSYSIPGNVALALSVEWPTATTPAYRASTAYTASSKFLGYFDPQKCYRYVVRKKGESDYSTSYFEPYGAAKEGTCASGRSLALWSGNYLNWASTQTLDAFRWVLTGGYRSVDTASETLLTKTYAAKDDVDFIPEKSVSGGVMTGATPFGSAKWPAGMTTRLRNLGNRMWFTSTNIGAADAGIAGSATAGAVPYTGQTTVGDDPKASDYADPAVTYEVYINVKVCDAKVGLEENCVAYGTNHKPEGLMQAYASNLRFSAFGYYNDDNYMRDGGVMRARMKFVGPSRPVPGSKPKVNDNAEWDAKTGVMVTNPDSGDATATAASAKAAGWEVAILNSGVMNYLNKFGNESKSYKSFDPVGELYYATQRYFRKLGSVPAYTSLVGAGSSATAARWLDGFPAIDSDEVWKSTGDSYGSSMRYSCEKNFILGIGDVNTHHDANLPGAAKRSQYEPDQPAGVSADRSVDVSKATNMVGQLEGLKGDAPLGTLFAETARTSCDWFCNTYHIAGLAYDAHTVDIREDLSGLQTIDTYWMDVVEKQGQAHKNQYWLAAKYGGFKVPEGFDPYAAGNGPKSLRTQDWYTNTDTITVTGWIKTPSYSTDAKKDERPDNYFPGNLPEKMKLGLTRAFESMSKATEATNGTALANASPNVSGSDTLNYSAVYNPKDWSGDLVASTLTFDSKGEPQSRRAWSAAALLDAAVGKTDTSARRIVTCCTAEKRGLVFTDESLSRHLAPSERYATFSAVSGVEKQSASDYVAYLRGARGQERANGGAYRTRGSVLGDVVNSKPTVVARPDAGLLDAQNPGYSAFKRRHAKRRTVVYVGANDGMLHAFDGTAGKTDSGRELFAYVPGLVYGSGTEAADRGLAALGTASYKHRAFVDATPYVADVDFGRTGVRKAGDTKVAKPDWHTLLIGGLGKGGRGYYALDVSNPADWTSEEKVADKVMWEFSDSRLGHSYGAPSVVKTRKYGWTVVVTSGYNNADGKGWFFFVNPANGELLEAVQTPEGSTGEPLNMAHHSLYVPEPGDFTADAVYAGDLRGNLWRVDLTGEEGFYPTPVRMAVLTNAKGTLLPVTTRPLIEVEPMSKRRYVMVGTGRLLADSDIADAQAQAFVAIVDGKAPFGSFSASGSAAAAFPVRRESLEPNSDLTTGIGGGSKSLVGWYHDLGLKNGIAKRIDVQPTAFQGTVAFAANVPNGDTCSPDGSGEKFAAAFGSGKSALISEANLIVQSVESVRTVREISFLRVKGQPRLYSGDSGGEVAKLPVQLPGPAGLRWLGWREISIGD